MCVWQLSHSFFLGVACARMQAEWPGHVRADQPDLRRDCLGCGLAASSASKSKSARAFLLAQADSLRLVKGKAKGLMAELKRR